MASLKDRIVAAYAAFREPYLVAQIPSAEDFSGFGARQLRYQIYWAFFENTAYRNLQTWARTYKRDFGLYTYIRAIYNPAYRLGTFWQTHLMGGLLDPAAGDGQGEPSALPIATENEGLRPAIAQLWKWSNWQVNKDIFSLRGAVFGDVALEVVDDVQKGKVYLRVVDPSTIKDVVLDDFRNVKGYTFEEARRDPEARQQVVTYTETAEREGQDVVYRTYRNGQPYAWPDQVDRQGFSRSEWSEPYGFVPLVVVRHYDVGLPWGWSELHAGRGKFQEADDLASKLSDQIRKMVNAPWLITGMKKSDSTLKATGRDTESYRETETSLDRPYPGREELPFFYATDPQAKAIPLVAPLNIADTAAYIDSILKELERDYPELQMDIWTASGDASGRALRVARQRAEAKVMQRRAGYDDALVRAQQMAIAIAGFRRLPGFEGFGLDSYERGDLDHSIGKRPVFAVDPLDDIEIDKEFWLAANEAIKAGMPLTVYLKRQGWSDEDLAELEASPERKARLALMQSGLEAMSGPHRFGSGTPQARGRGAEQGRDEGGDEPGGAPEGD